MIADCSNDGIPAERADSKSRKSVMSKVLLYSDGACSPNPGTGGWGTVLIAPGFDNKRMELSGAEFDTDQQPHGAHRRRGGGLRVLNSPCEVIVRTDSQYLRNAFTQNWLTNWQRNGWRTASKKPVKNQDLWMELLKLAKKHKIKWEWVKGHACDTENNRCDELAVQARLDLEAGRQPADL